MGNPIKNKVSSDGSNFYYYPENVIKCWYVSELERLSANKSRRPYCDNLDTSCYFRLQTRIDANHTEAYIGRDNEPRLFHAQIDTSIEYFADYKRRMPIYFTTDKVSLFKVLEIQMENPLKFILQRLDNQKFFKKGQSFMIMPFQDEQIDRFYKEVIKPLLESILDVKIYRADDFRDNDIIIETIYEQIEAAEFIIADTTINNKNAFYEIGYAAALGKEIITIQNKNSPERLFFDRAHIRTILYDPTSITQFQFELESTIQSIRGRH